ncbi:hypothetical protein HMPREF0574_0937 [Mobiluncus curtisii subsp. curtisii ATCC 35241]|uniref:Uncharacterized protein n=3 Tax=Mobiluncus TaxID=2050 RepID=D6ZKI0_MOBCV|nr:hypothetical protein HMPREF0573_10910 [Mobiluncus curtisii ATCC 43063]EFL93931.1 hypothetical protein HMPREF0574_0937 [Mobiluncus curtisii subsp. curtisii ATCC 35241]EFU81550.1 hypothetical protein HMPREF0576_1392 [Mobiluncus holmesii ATCC 35242]MCU9986489.1 hypothetical protein [Mobiluncus curtisii]MCV0000204.1 hypothetical protein [Mobiluncus curtisii]
MFLDFAVARDWLGPLPYADFGVVAAFFEFQRFAFAACDIGKAFQQVAAFHGLILGYLND